MLRCSQHNALQLLLSLAVFALAAFNFIPMYVCVLALSVCVYKYVAALSVPTVNVFVQLSNEDLWFYSVTQLAGDFLLVASPDEVKGGSCSHDYSHHLFQYSQRVACGLLG